jgi:hypothetical protein
MRKSLDDVEFRKPLCAVEQVSCYGANMWAHRLDPLSRERFVDQGSKPSMVSWFLA